MDIGLDLQRAYDDGYKKGWEEAEAYALHCGDETPMTNADRLRSMTDKELAEWLAEVLFHCSNTICDERCPMYKCCCDQPSDNIEDWLKQEAT